MKTFYKTKDGQIFDWLREAVEHKYKWKDFIDASSGDISEFFRDILVFVKAEDGTEFFGPGKVKKCKEYEKSLLIPTGLINPGEISNILKEYVDLIIDGKNPSEEEFKNRFFESGLKSIYGEDVFQKILKFS